MEKINYGIDAPVVIRNLAIAGLLMLLLIVLFPVVSIGDITFSTSGFIWTALTLLIVATLMFLYSKFGKVKHRDRILQKIQWRGDEKVLDVGTGLGLLMIGAAKHLTTGKSVGIDIFNSYDLSANTETQTKINAELENEAEKIEIRNENILKTTFPDECFDVVVSNLCLHNLYKSEERKRACAEIYRITKPGGQVIISDFKHTSEYKKAFSNLGMTVQREGTYYFDTFPPLTIIKAIKE